MRIPTRPAGRPSARAREEHAGWLFVAPVMGYVLVVFVLPLLFLLYATFFRWSIIDGPGPFVGLRVLVSTLADPLFRASLVNSALFMLAGGPATVGLALLVAVALSRRSPLPFKGFLKVAYTMPLITSLAATAFIWLWLFNPSYGLFNAILGALGLPRLAWLTDTAQVIPSLALMYLWVRLGFDLAILLAGLESIPEELYEAARLDGAGPGQIFARITLPLLNGPLVVVSVVEVITSLKTFELPFVATHGGPVNASRTAVLHIYDTAFRYNEISKASAAALVLFVLILLVTLVQLRLLARRVEY